MILTVHEQGDLLIVKQADHIELKQLDIIAKAKPAPTFKGRGQKPTFHDPISFFHNQKYLPVGLLFRILDLKNKQYDVQIENLHYLIQNIQRDELRDWVDTLETPFNPHYYQHTAIYNFLRYNKCSQNIGTSGGKTFIFYCTFKALRKFKQHGIDKPAFLAIVPTVQLVEQIQGDFDEYQENEDDSDPVKVYKIHASAINEFGIQDANVVCSTFHSLQEQPKEFFDRFNGVFVDECHQAKIFSIINVMTKLTHVKWRFGMTGSKPEDEMDLLNAECYVGGFCFDHPVWKMHRDGHVNDFEIVSIEIHHSHEQTKSHFEWLNITPDAITDKAWLRRAEQEYIFNNAKRNTVIAKIAQQLGYNVIILCSRVPAIKNHQDAQTSIESNVQSHAVWGDVHINDRLDIINAVKEGVTGHIINAHVRCLGTGTSIKTLVYAIFDGIGKSFYVTLQAVGRMLRKHPDKGKAIILDISDVMHTNYKINGLQRYAGHNYSVRHKKQRFKHYENHKYPIAEKTITVNI